MHPMRCTAVALDLLAGDRAGAQKHMRLVGAGTLPEPKAEMGAEYGVIEIPGPLRSFSRMAALSMPGSFRSMP